MRILVSFFSLIAIFALSGCTSSEDTALLHREITDVQRSIDNMQAEVIDKSDLRGMEQSMQDLTDKNMRSNADLAQRVVELQEQIERLNDQLSNMEHTFDVLTKKIDDVLWMQKLEDVAWVAEQLRRHGGREAWEVAGRLCR